jgi:DNA-binding response OmpR family regulator
MVLLLSANWPERALMRAQLASDSGREVIGVDSAEAAVEWLRGEPFSLAIIDTQGLPPDAQLVQTLDYQRTPVLLLTWSAGRADWAAATAGLDVRATLARPVFIGDISRAACQLLGSGARSETSFEP